LGQAIVIFEEADKTLQGLSELKLGNPSKINKRFSNGTVQSLEQRRVPKIEGMLVIVMKHSHETPSSHETQQKTCRWQAD
jgi:hypothetical protein